MIKIEVMGTGQTKYVTMDDGENVVRSGRLDEDEQQALRLVLVNAALELCEHDVLHDELSGLLNKYEE